MDERSSKKIPLTQGQFAIVDADDYEELARYKWHATKTRHTYYAARKHNSRTIAMHRQILNAPKHLHCDHINHNGLDNRRANLRLCTLAENSRNRRLQCNGSSKYKGVCWNKDKKKWQANIKVNGKQMHIGYYDNELDAAIAYDDRAIELFGEFAALNCNCRPEIKQWLQQSCLFQPHRIAFELCSLRS